MKTLNIKASLVPVLLLAVAAISSASGDKEATKACQKDPVVKEAKPGCEKAARERQCVESKHGSAKEIRETRAKEAKSCGGGKNG